jgi:peptidoglycan L-alanyl-D-glutamate endopeptidase CwlK
MPKFSEKSEGKLRGCHPDLQRLFNEVVKYFDCKIDCGYRGEEEQNEAFRTNHSTKKYPDSKHNSVPSIAVDVVPYPVDWENLKRFYFFGGYVKRTADIMGINVRWGGDWDSDTVLNDQSFNDLPHWEILQNEIKGEL